MTETELDQAVICEDEVMDIIKQFNHEGNTYLMDTNILDSSELFKVLPEPMKKIYREIYGVAETGASIAFWYRCSSVRHWRDCVDSALLTQTVLN